MLAVSLALLGVVSSFALLLLLLLATGAFFFLFFFFLGFFVSGTAAAGGGDDATGLPIPSMPLSAAVASLTSSCRCCCCSAISFIAVDDGSSSVFSESFSRYILGALATKLQLQTKQSQSKQEPREPLSMYVF